MARSFLCWILGEVPKWLWNLSPALNHFNLSHNQISGTIPDFSSNSIEIIDVSSNKFSGPLPLFHPDTWIFQLSPNMFPGSISSIRTISSSILESLDLSNNQLAEELRTCWEKMPSISLLNLANNSFSGEIPHALGFLQHLWALHLRDNNFSGELPSTLKNCQYLQVIDIGQNKLTGNIPTWIGANYTQMKYLSLRQNRFYGNIPPEICNLNQIQILDLAENNISGKIPKCFNNFTSLVEESSTTVYMVDFGFALSYDIPNSSAKNIKDYIEYALAQWKGQESDTGKLPSLLKLINLLSNKLDGNIPKAFFNLRGLISLNLSRNNLTGNIDRDIAQMEMLEYFDLSRNQLYGQINIGLAKLHYLAILDLANNNLSRKIPSSTQLQSFNAYVYVGNNDLCGAPLILCPDDSLNPSVGNEGENIKEKDGNFRNLSFIEEFGIAMAFGFILGFWGVVGTLLLKKSWRSAYFNFWDVAGNQLNVTATLFFTKFKRILN